LPARQVNLDLSGSSGSTTVEKRTPVNVGDEELEKNESSRKPEKQAKKIL
jgi:hypothetical protein